VPDETLPIAARTDLRKNFDRVTKAAFPHCTRPVQTCKPRVPTELKQTGSVRVSPTNLCDPEGPNTRWGSICNMSIEISPKQYHPLLLSSQGIP
jgi:hypothetical protein